MLYSGIDGVFFLVLFVLMLLCSRLCSAITSSFIFLSCEVFMCATHSSCDYFPPFMAKWNTFISLKSTFLLLRPYPRTPNLLHEYIRPKNIILKYADPVGRYVVMTYNGRPASGICTFTLKLEENVRSNSWRNAN